MKKTQNGTKIIVVGMIILALSAVIIQAHETIPSYSISRLEPLLYGYSACGDNSTDGNDSGGGSGNWTGGDGNWTGGGDNESGGGNGNWTGGNENETGGNTNETGGSGNETGGNNESGGSEPGKVYGTVYSVSNDSQIPLENAEVAIMYNENFTDILAATYTDQNGFYSFYSLAPGLYQIRVTKDGYYASINTLDLYSNESIEKNFVLEIESDWGYPPDNGTIRDAIKDGRVGGEINVWPEDNSTYSREVLIYNNINITKLDIEKGAISFNISGNESDGGRTIVLNVNSTVFKPNDPIAVEYDGEAIKMADDINDVLNPNDDGSHAEYLISIGSNGTQILVSIPHFSEHSIKLFSLTPQQASQYLVYAAIAAVVLIIIASVVMFRKGREED